jgi:hypothetical protein
MTGFTLPRWVFSWLCRWFPHRVRARRRPLARFAQPMLTVLEERFSPTSLSATPPVELAPPPLYFPS